MRTTIDLNDDLVVTHPRIFSPPTPVPEALGQIEALMDSPSLVLLGQGLGHRGHVRRAVGHSGTAGNLVHDAHIAALLLEHGVTELLTEDRDFTRFERIGIRPLPL